MFRVNAKTRTTTALAFDGNRVRLDHPQFLAECPEDRVPYVLPSPEGGYLIFAEYGNPCPSEEKPSKPCCAGCGNGCGCENDKSVNHHATHPKKPKMEQKEAERLIRFEIVKYSGYDSDGLTLLVTERGVEGTIKQDWPAGSLVMQTMTGTELKDVLAKIQAIKSFLDELGCILAVPRNPDGACGGWKEGDWACFGGKFYRSKVDGNCTNAPGDKWDGGIDLFDLLDMYFRWIVDCDSKRIPFGSKVVTCENMRDFLCSISITDTRKKPSGSPVVVTRVSGDCDPQFIIDYNTSITPSTATAPSGPYRLIVEASDGKEYVLRSGSGYREHYDGKVEMWGRTIVGVGSEDRAVAAVLPVKLDGPITYGNSHISLTDVGWAAAPGEHLDDLPGAYPNDPSTDKLDQTDMGWGPSTANPTGEFVIWAYQHEQGGSAAIELVSWHLITERGLA